MRSASTIARARDPWRERKAELLGARGQEQRRLERADGIGGSGGGLVRLLETAVAPAFDESVDLTGSRRGRVGHGRADGRVTRCASSQCQRE
jgi:hypothetical protein